MPSDLVRTHADGAVESAPRFSERGLESAERERLLAARIDQLGLRIEGSRLEPLVQTLYGELERAGILLRPEVYLAEEWGCPDGLPVIGIPFYLADERLLLLEREALEGVEAETDEDVLRYLRHEAGHAFGYAYRLYETEDWHRLFGPYSRPYREDYEPNPFSRKFVRHLAGWYAQKHPDEDWAESFAVWLDPGSDWRNVYAGWGCMPKLEYVERVVRELGKSEPKIAPRPYDPGDELFHSVAEHHRRFGYQAQELPAYFDGDLRELFEPEGRAQKPGRAPAQGLILGHRRHIVRDVAYWTGLHEHTVRALVEHLAERARVLGLAYRVGQQQRLLMQLTAYVTTLAMNRLYKGDFIVK
jgi:hypothetical protein